MVSRTEVVDSAGWARRSTRANASDELARVKKGFGQSNRRRRFRVRLSDLRHRHVRSASEPECESGRDAAQHVETVRARQHHVKHHQFVFIRQSSIHAPFAVVNRFNRKPSGWKILSDQLAQANVVVDYQNALHWLTLLQDLKHMDDLRASRGESYSTTDFRA